MGGGDGGKGRGGGDGGKGMGGGDGGKGRGGWGGGDGGKGRHTNLKFLVVLLLRVHLYLQSIHLKQLSPFLHVVHSLLSLEREEASFRAQQQRKGTALDKTHAVA